MTKYYIGHTNNYEDRFKASSGGIGTVILRHLLSKPEFGTAVTFCFNKEKCMYEPRLIYSSDEINVCGSIYQDINLVRFISDNVEKINHGIVLVSPPCQVGAIRKILNKNGVMNFILSFCCSGQMTIDGTWRYYGLLGIDKANIINMQYRGNGWPSGIQIWLKNGTIIKRDNYTEPWVTIHRSNLYKPKRCLYCVKDTGRDADISLADPWLDYYKKNDNVGNTLFLVNTEEGGNVIEELVAGSRISIVNSSYEEYAIAQKPNLMKEHNRVPALVLSLMKNRHYYSWATSSFRNMNYHIKVQSCFKIIKNLISK